MAAVYGTEIHLVADLPILKLGGNVMNVLLDAENAKNGWVIVLLAGSRS